jgi:hypothetical protein
MAIQMFQQWMTRLRLGLGATTTPVAAGATTQFAATDANVLLSTGKIVQPAT